MSLKLIDKSPGLKVVSIVESTIIKISKTETKIIQVGNLENVTFDTSILSVQKFVLKNDNIGLEVYANDGITLLFKIDGAGNVGTLGTFYSL